MTPLTSNHARGAGFQAAQMLFQSGAPSIYPAALYQKIHFGAHPKARRESLERAIAAGWLKQNAVMAIELGDPALVYFKPLGAKPRLLGQVAGPRTSSAYDRPPLRGITNSRGTHARDIDSRFQRGPEHHFFSVPAGMP